MGNIKIFVLFLILATDLKEASAIQWCVKNVRPCYETPEEVCAKHTFGITAQACERVFLGVTATDPYGPSYCIGANQDYIYTPEGWIASKPTGGELKQHLPTTQQGKKFLALKPSVRQKHAQL